MTDLTPVQSKHIAAIGYEPDKKTLHVRFQGNDRVYRYSGVDQHLHAGLMDAESKGRFFRTHIRGKFDHS